MDERRWAKARLVAGMLSGRSRAEAAADAGMRTSRTAAYRLCRAVGERGDAALVDGRRGHASKLRPRSGPGWKSTAAGCRPPLAPRRKRRCASGSASTSASATSIVSAPRSGWARFPPGRGRAPRTRGRMRPLSRPAARVGVA